MAAIWADIQSAPSQVIMDNKAQAVIFEWQFITFSGEIQAMAEVRWRKAGVYAGIYERMSPEFNTWTGYAYVTRQPGDPNLHIAIPTNTLSEGVWFFEVRMKIVGQEGGDWSGYTPHSIEISRYDSRQDEFTSATTVVKGPHWDSEGTYGQVVQAMSAAGIWSADSNESQYAVWTTNKFVKLENGDVVPVPEHRKEGTLVGRVIRPA